MKCRFNVRVFFFFGLPFFFFIVHGVYKKKKDTLCGTRTRDVDGVVGMMRIFLELLRHVDAITGDVL